MNDRIEWLRGRYESFLVRERLLLLAAVVAVIYLLWDFIAIQPFSDELQRLQAQEEKLLKEIQTTGAELTVFTNLASKDPAATLEQEVTALRRRLTEIDAQLAELSVGLIPSDQLPAMLHDVLKSQKNLQLVQLRTLPPEQVALVPQEDKDTSAGDQPAPSSQEIELYRHGVELRLRGGYRALNDYLVTLENNAWKFYWENLYYEVIVYPEAETTLKVFTLSGDRGLFGG